MVLLLITITAQISLEDNSVTLLLIVIMPQIIYFIEEFISCFPSILVVCISQESSRECEYIKELLELPLNITLGE